MRRSDSYAHKYSEEEVYVKNIEWMDDPFVWIFYPLAIFGTFSTVMLVTQATVAEALTVTNLFHGALTFVFLHWVKGSADFYDQGTFNGLTLWEQINPSGGWNAAKKYLALVPTVLLLITLMASGYSHNSMAINIPVWLALVVGKFPSMYRVRILGINSTPGIDDGEKAK